MTCWHRLTVVLSHQYHVALVAGAGGRGKAASVVDRGCTVQKRVLWAFTLTGVSGGHGVDLLAQTGSCA